VRQNTMAALQDALAKHNAGDLGGAARAYRAILKRDPAQADAMHLLGLTAHQTGDQARAIRHIEKAVAMKPKEPVFLGNLGLAHHAAGNLDLAEGCFRRALTAVPAYYPARLHLGSVLAAQGRDEGALSEFLALIDITLSDVPAVARPDMASLVLAHAKAAQALRNLGRFEDAVEQYERAILLAPSDAELLASYASLEQIRGHIDAAVEIYHRALALQPVSPQISLNLGHCYLEQGLFDEALTAFKAAQEPIGGGNYESAVAGIASLHERAGAYKEAWTVLEPLIENASPAKINPVLATTFALIAGHLGREEDAISVAEGCLEMQFAETVGNFAGTHTSGPHTSGTGETNLRFALGRLYERQVDYHKAFVQFEIANRKTKTKFDPVAFRDSIDALIKVFATSNPKTVAQNIDERPVFIVGMPRSGTTLVEQILASHGQIYGGGELSYLHQALDTMPRPASTEMLYPEVVDQVSAANLDVAAYNYLDKLAQLAPNAARITDKMPGNILHLGAIARLFPRAHIIHVRRNPLDTCLSCFTQNFGERLVFTTDLSDLADYYLGYNRLSEHWRGLTNLPMLEISYEELVGSVETGSRRMIDFLGLEWDPACLDFHRNERAVSTASYAQVRQPIYQGAVGKWQDYRRELEPLIAKLSQAGAI
jgi:tetratricopeptide (TPR) repeat protein